MHRLVPILVALLVAGSGWLAAMLRQATQPRPIVEAPAAGPRSP